MTDWLRTLWLRRKFYEVAMPGQEDWFDQAAGDEAPAGQPAFAVTVLVLSLTLTWLAWHYSSLHIHERAHDRFEYRADGIEKAIQARMSGYEQVLRHTAAMMGDPASIDASTWRKIYEQIDFEVVYPGTQGFGVMVPIAPSELAADLTRNSVAAAGAFDVATVPVPLLKHATRFIEPMDVRNQRVFGFDMSVEPVRRKAMLRAITSGQASISGRVTLVQETGEDVQAGILFFVPVYSRDLPAAPTAEDRVRNYLGMVYTALRVDDLMRGILGVSDAGVDFQLYDALAMGADVPLYATNRANPYSDSEETLFSTDRQMELFGHHWHLAVSADRGFILDSEHRESLVVAMAGFMVDLLLFASILFLNRQRLSARAGALRMFRAFQDGEERFRLVVNAADDGMLMIDRNGRITLANAASAHRFGYSRGAMLEREITTLLPSLNWTESVAPVLDRRFSAAGEFEGMATRLEARGMRRDGVVFPAEVVLTPMRFLDKPYVLVTVNDITERLAFETEREERLLELQRSNEDLENFAHVASHDLKAPLRAIDNLAAWVSEDAGNLLPEESRRHLDLMRRRINRMETLLNDLLIYGRVGQQAHPVEAIGIAALVDEVRDLVRPSDHFVFSVVGDRAQINTWRAPLRQVLINLVGNAIKHRGADAGRVEIRWRTLIDEIEFEVADDGPGVPPEYRERVFELYQTLKPRDTLESSGMGLALVRRIVERVGGTVGIVDSPVPGTLVRFTWPLRSVAKSDLATSPDVEPAACAGAVSAISNGVPRGLETATPAQSDRSTAELVMS